MSIEAMTLVYKSGLDKAEKAIALAYADHAHDDGSHIYPSVKYTAWKTGYSRRSVQAATKSLVESGILVSVGLGPNKTNHYKMDFSKLPQRPPFRGGAKSAPHAIGDNQGVQNLHGGVQPLREGGATTAPKSLYKPSYEPSEEYIYDAHEENDNLKTIAASIACEVKTPYGAGFNEDKFEQAASIVMGWGAVDSISGFAEWWKSNGYYSGKPALKTFLDEYQNYLDGAVLENTNGQSRAEIRQQQSISAIDKAFDEMEAQGLI